MFQIQFITNHAFSSLLLTGGAEENPKFRRELKIQSKVKEGVESHNLFLVTPHSGNLHELLIS